MYYNLGIPVAINQLQGEKITPTPGGHLIIILELINVASYLIYYLKLYSVQRQHVLQLLIT